MKYLFVNPLNNMIGTTIDADYNTLESSVFKFNVYVPGTSIPYRQVNWDDVVLPRDITQEQVYKNISQYICDETNVLHIRPFITLGVQEGYTNYVINSHGALLLPINTVVPIVVSYNDPSGVGYIHESKTVKIKDRNDFVELPFKEKTFDIVDGIQQTRFVFNISSDTAGAFELRAKDTKYLCYYESMVGKFKKNL